MFNSTKGTNIQKFPITGVIEGDLVLPSIRQFNQYTAIFTVNPDHKETNVAFKNGSLEFDYCNTHYSYPFKDSTTVTVVLGDSAEFQD